MGAGRGPHGHDPSCDDGRAAFLVSDMELVRKGPSYTVDTMRILHRRWHRFYDLYFIIGGDSAEALDTWCRIEETMRYCTFLAIGRVGYRERHEDVTKRLAQKDSPASCGLTPKPRIFLPP